MLKYHIQTIEVGTATANITFSSIPQIYDDLLVVASFRSSESTVGSNAEIRFNNSSTGYSSRLLYGGGSGAGASATGGSDRIQWAPTTSGNSSTANTFGNASIYIANYRSSVAKSVSIDAVAENNATTSRQDINAALWNNTAAITSISFTWEQTANFVQFSSASLYGITRGSDGTIGVLPAAEGGTVTTSGGYTIHTFNSSGTFTTNRALNVEYLVVGGGGGGGTFRSGGGGAGGYRTNVSGATSGGGASAEPALSLPARTSYTIIVGGGGPTATPATNGANGSDSVFSTITSLGGGGGGTYQSASVVETGQNGGSGGGAGSDFPIGSYSGGSGTSGQGYNGGSSVGMPVNGGWTAGGGGGGAGAAGTNAIGENLASTNNIPGNGGNGVASLITGTSITRAGGGGGGGISAGGSELYGTGGTGGGGNGNAAGGVNTGGGGGVNRAGGSGVVIIRYLTPA